VIVPVNRVRFRVVVFRYDDMSESYIDHTHLHPTISYCYDGPNFFQIICKIHSVSAYGMEGALVVTETGADSR
jgi:plastocyanin